MFLIDTYKQGELLFGGGGIVAVAALLLAICTAIVLHEVSHGYAALINGDDTAKMLGRLSLNPIKHFNWLGFFMMLLVGFGYANPVPVNPVKFKNFQRGSIQVSISGILTNLVLAFIFTLFLGLLNLLNVALEGVWLYVVSFLALYFVFSQIININFALFNILPLYPLDGYRLLNCFIPDENKFMTFLRRYSFIILIGLIIIGNNSYLSQYSPLDLYISYGRLGISGAFEWFWSLLGLRF